MVVEKVQLPHRATKLLLAASCAVVCNAGCKSADSAIVGDWKDTGGQISTFKQDKTFSEGSGGAAASGKWSLSGKTVTVNIQTIGGKTVDEAIDSLAKSVQQADPKKFNAGMVAKMKGQLKEAKLTLSDDGKTMTAVSAITGTPVTFTKVVK
jgi:hypothetical protein